MATGIEAKIARALLNRLSTMANLPSVAWPNLNFTPTTGTEYLRPAIVGTATTQSTLGSSGFNRYSGIFQVDVFYPRNEGLLAPLELAARVATHFKRGTSFAEGGITVRVESPPTVMQAIPEGPWVQVPVSVSWFVDTTNPA